MVEDVFARAARYQPPLLVRTEPPELPEELESECEPTFEMPPAADGGDVGRNGEEDGNVSAEDVGDVGLGDNLYLFFA